MRSANSRLAVGVLLGCLALQADQEDPVIRADVNVVVLHATVKDRNRFVRGLSKDAFKVTEDGTPQQISFFSSEEVPVAVGLIIDESGSMVRRRSDVINGALSFIAATHPKDEMFVVNFNEEATTGLPDGQPFSSSATELRNALLSTQPAGQTALYDAIMLGIRHLDQATMPKKVLVVVSDGADNRSRHTVEDVVKAADRNGVILYTIGLFDESSDDRNPGVLRRLAKQTGGSVYLPEDLTDMRRICAEIAQDVRNQYAVGYSSSNTKLDGAYRQVSLTAVDEKGRSLRARTRTGYFGAKEREPAVKETEQPAPPAPK